MRIGVLGGTFDPPHLGHLVLAEQAREQLGLERVLWVPSGDPWRKVGAAVTPGDYRLAMAQLAIEGQPAFEASQLEVDRPGPSFSVDTLRELQKQHPEAGLVFIVGQDALEDLANWREPRALLELATLAVAKRGEQEPALDALERALAGVSERVVWLEMPRIDISATDVRRRVAGGRSIRYLVPAAVEAYITEHGLYRGR